MFKHIKNSLIVIVLQFVLAGLLVISVVIPGYFVLYTQEFVNVQNYWIIIPIRIFLIILTGGLSLWVVLKNRKRLFSTKYANLLDRVADIGVLIFPIVFVMLVVGYSFTMLDNYSRYGYGTAQVEQICRKYIDRGELIGSSRINLVDVVNSSQEKRRLHISNYNFDRLLISARDGDCREPNSPIIYDKLFGYVLDF